MCQCPAGDAPDKMPVNLEFR